MPLPPPDTDAAHARALAARVADAAARGGAADVAYALVDTPCGEMVAAVSGRGLARLAYTDHPGGLDRVLDGLAERISPRVVEAPSRLDDWRRELDAYFEGRLREFTGALDWTLTEGFTRAVLEATARIPYGETSTYGGVAADAGSPKAFRAAGGALGSNPLAVVVPCHRVLAAGGRMGGYTGGVHRKEILLGVEGALPGRLL